MLKKPSEIYVNKLIKNVTLDFETDRKQFGNLIIVPSEDRKEVHSLIKSGLLKQGWVYSVYTPRRVTPMKRKPKMYNINDLFKEYQKETDSKITFLKLNPLMYKGKNLVYDLTSEWSDNMDVIRPLRQGNGLFSTANELLGKLIQEKTKLEYEKKYLVITIDSYIDKLKSSIIGMNHKNTNPLIILLKDLRQNNFKTYRNLGVDEIFFVNPKAETLLRVDISSKDDKFKYPTEMIIGFIERMNNFNNGTDNLDDVEDANLNVSQEEEYNNMKERLKEFVFTKIAKELKIKVNSFEFTTREEEELMYNIEKQIEDILKDPKNKNINFRDLVNIVSNNNAVKSSSARFIQTKKIINNKTANMAKNISKELEALEIMDTDIDDLSYGIIESTKIKTKVPLHPMVQSSKLISIDSEYNEKYLKNDIKNVITAFGDQSFQSMAIDSLEIEDTSDDFNEKETFKIRYKTEDNQSLSMRIDVPKVVDGRYILVNGNKFIIPKQQLRLPIVKTKKDTVEITSSYLKMTLSRAGSNVSRKNAYLSKILKELGVEKVKVTYGDNGIVNAKYTSDFEFEELGESVSSITKNGYRVMFNRQAMEDECNLLDISDNFHAPERTPFCLKDETIYFLENGSVHEYDTNKSEIKNLEMNMFQFIVGTVLSYPIVNLPKIGNTFMYSKVKFLQTQFPVFALVGLMKGIRDTLKVHKVKYNLHEKPIKLGAEWVHVKFKDKHMYYEDKLENTMLLNALYSMDTELYDFNDFNTDKPYIDYLVSKLKQPLYVKNTAMINLEKMIDPITLEVLNDMKLPTDICDLLLLGSNMLVNNSYDPLNDFTNYRIRGNEVIPAALYKIMSDAVVKFQNHKLNGRPSNIEIRQKELISKLISLPNINTSSTLNPIMEIDNAFACGAKGLNGVNQARAFTLEMKTYDRSMTGFVSGNATPYSGAAGITRSMVYDPDINHIRGYTNTAGKDRENAVGLLGMAEMLSPFSAAHADPPRIAMIVAQSKHTMPTAVSHKQLIGSGANKTLCQMISDDFCYKAKDSGKVVHIDDKEKIAILKYTNGETDAVDLKEALAKNSNSGFYIRQNFVFKYKVGESFTKGDVLAYDASFFKGRGGDVDYCCGTLAKIALTPGDFAYEDSTMISSKLSKKCATRITMCKAVSITGSTEIYDIVDVGDEVVANDSLLEFTEGFGDDMTNAFLKGLEDDLGTDDANLLTRDHVHTKYSGTIVDVKIYYNKPLNELSDSLQNLIKKYSNTIQKRKDLLTKHGVTKTSVKIPPLVQQTNNKINGVEYDGVLIEFYIEYLNEMGVGDKLSFQTALKGVVSKVMPEEEAPTTEYRPEEKIEAICTPTGIIGRMTMDFYSIIHFYKVLVELGKQIKEIVES